MNSVMHRSKASALIGGIASIILGVIIFMNPTSSALTITTMVGWVLLILGVASLATAFRRVSLIFSQIDLYIGILCSLIGIGIVSWPQFFVAWIFILLGIYIMVSGFNSLFAANALRMTGLPGSTATFVGSIVGIVLGAMVMFSPFTMANFTMSLCGIALIYMGVVTLLEGLRMKDETEG